MAPFQILSVGGGQAWSFNQILAHAVQTCTYDFSICELKKRIKKMFKEEFENFDLFPALEDIDELTLWEINIWPQDETPSNLNPMELPTQDPIFQEDPFESFTSFATSHGRYFDCYMKFYLTTYLENKWKKILNGNGSGDG